MTGFQKIKKQLLPLLKGLHIVAGSFIIALLIAFQIINYSPNVYNTMAKIKLDDQKFNFSGGNLYKDFDVFSTKYKIEAESELLRSPLLVGKALDSLDFNVQIHRKGRLKNTMLYKNSPIRVTYDFDNMKLYNSILNANISETGDVQLMSERTGKEVFFNGRLEEPIEIDGGTITIHKNSNIIKEKGIALIGEYLIKVFSRDNLIADVSSRLDVAAIDKEIAVLRVVYKDENPQKMADFTNTLCEEYIRDYVDTKSNGAAQTLKFIDKKLQKVGIQLAAAESALENFKLNNKVVNTLQETETGLREISKLNLQLVNLEMNEQSVIELQNYISSGKYFEETAIKFGFGDLLLTELVKKMKLWQDEKRDLLIKYTPDSDQVQAVDAKIAEVKRYIKEAIDQNLKEIQIKRADIQEEVETARHMFDNLPTREKKQHVLEREFRILEDVFNFLSHKKIESSIAESVQHCFHRIIQRAAVPTKASAPNKTLISFVAGLLGLIIGMSFIYIRSFVKAKIVNRDDLERKSELPIAGIIRSKDSKVDFNMLAKSILLKNLISPGQTLTISSTIQKEGKTFVSTNLAKALKKKNYSICLLGSDYSVSIEEHLASHDENKNEIQKLHVDFDNISTEQQIQELKNLYDFVLIDALPTAISVNGIEAMKLADLNLFIFRSNHTSVQFSEHADCIKEEYGINNIQLILNDAHKATNFSGAYIGSKFSRQKKTKGFKSILQNYFNLYMSR